jgi:hypothetical protein
MKNLLFFAILLCLHSLKAQTTQPERLLDFNVAAKGEAYQFNAVMPPLLQKPGAPKAFWSYFWEFGDGDFGLEETPTHAYAKQGDYDVIFDAVAHYDDGKRARRKKRSTGANAAPKMAGVNTLHDVFEGQQMVAIKSFCKPRAEEEITFVLSYRNLGAVPTDGSLHLFYNEKRFPTTHFTHIETRIHFGETVDASTSMVLPLDPYQESWAGLPLRTWGGVSTSLSGDFPPSIIIQEMLNNARGTYRAENAWQFTNLEAGEKRNVFVTLAGTPNMLRDTNAMIHLTAVFAPTNPLVAPEQFVYEIEIVSSHDPNAIAVSDNRVNYRSLGSKKLDYKIQFQNNGEGPASTVQVKVEIPDGLKMGAMRPVEWYPKCPICPKTPTTKGCLDTASQKDGLVFTFRNIYLPGSRQEDVDDRDSTKGFVKYRIEADRNMPKRPFRSRAKIVFDKNPPIYTNYTKTGFKVGLSPGLKAGYGFDPDSVRNGYFFLGISLSPYKSWRIYPQVELLTGIKGRSDLRVVEKHLLFGTQPNNGIALLDSTIIDTFTQARRGFVSFEVPVLIRKNFTRFFGLGLGASARILLENGETQINASRTTIDWSFTDSPAGFVLKRNVINGETMSTVTNYKNTLYRFAVFGDLTLGAVRAGPNLGIRGGVVLGKKKVQPFVQVSLELRI